jgi:hypothetical protein
MVRRAQTSEAGLSKRSSTRPSPKGKSRKARKSSLRRQTDAVALHHAVQIIYRVCCLAGTADLVDEVRRDLRGIPSAIRRRDTGPLFDWLAAMLSYQGISDQVAADYMDRHGRAEWPDINRKMSAGPSCPKLKTYWHFCGCRYDKISRTCAEPDHIDQCPLPGHVLRNGRLNQTAYSLYLFIRDIAGGDLAGWIDRQLRAADQPRDANRLARLRAALIDPLREVYGVSDKVLAMTLSSILLAAPRGRERWREVGGSMIAVDTLVHNFLHRTGILARFRAEHHYGAACYQDGRCADILGRVARQIDARGFNPDFPVVFPRFVQHAVWRFCAQNGLGVCNGNRIDDRKQCENVYCQVRHLCDRITLHIDQ